ncbi:hypothetical protein MBEHAL_1393 [Halarchaeum acidiphilum MH1-52-1]|uniref:Uncharacterized protein n=1 Tax=Halarchaeum acidiphilum MH1-52-1 TaxID=1261545 RepID=U3ACY3_9EURY|nr:hypothetical protein MBEHAL_1393 [Halarchaeum acidiphilum MH1-52-1]
MVTTPSSRETTLKAPSARDGAPVPARLSVGLRSRSVRRYCTDDSESPVRSVGRLASHATRVSLACSLPLVFPSGFALAQFDATVRTTPSRPYGQWDALRPTLLVRSIPLVRLPEVPTDVAHDAAHRVHRVVERLAVRAVPPVSRLPIRRPIDDHERAFVAALALVLGDVHRFAVVRLDLDHVRSSARRHLNSPRRSGERLGRGHDNHDR